MKLLTVLLAVVTTFALSACATGIVERKVPAKKCSGGSCCR